jgi:hypothetical protein
MYDLDDFVSGGTDWHRVQRNRASLLVVSGWLPASSRFRDAIKSIKHIERNAFRVDACG